MKTYIGIDPGQKGGISLIHDGNIFCFEMPVNSLKQIDVAEIGSELTFFFSGISPDADTDNIFCVIEKAQSMPKQGLVSTFNYGVGYGKLLCLLEINNIPYQEIRPTEWKKAFSLLKKDKSFSVALAEKLQPTIDFRTARKRLMDGKAESYLIAEYARRKNL